MTPRHAARLFVCSFLAILFTHTCFASNPPLFTLEEKVAQSDVVLIGRAVGVPLHRHGQAVMTVEVVEVLKGTLPKSVRLLTKGMAGGLNPDCCEAGSNYLLFLKKDRDFYITAAGPYGVHKLPKE